MGYHAAVLDGLFGGSTKFSWQLDSVGSSGVLCLAGAEISHSDIAGVLVTRPLMACRAATASDSASYSNSERDATLLGWIWSLRCRVINRYAPEFWFARPASTHFWRDRLESFGLSTTDLTEPIRNRSSRDATGSKQGHLAAMIGSRVVWDEGASEEAQRTAGALARFTASLGLEYLEIRLDDSTGKPSITEIELFPKYVEFSLPRRQQIINELLALLASEQRDLPLRTAADSWF
jgi:hypothetical protein